MSGKDKPTQNDLARKAMQLKEAGQPDPSAMAEDAGPLHPHDIDADAGKKGLDDTKRRTAPSGALDHAGATPARERSKGR